MLIVRTPLSLADRMGSTETNCTQIAAIDIFDSLGYRGCGREEHSGENTPRDPEDLLAELADNEMFEA